MHFTWVVFAYALVGSFENPPPPPPPPSLRAWVDYAHALNGDAGCPPDLPCLHLSRVAFFGKPATGAITIRVTGQNVGKRTAQASILSPAAEVAVVKAHFTAGNGVLHLGDGNEGWTLAAQPGVFAFEAELRFEPQDSLSLELPSPVASVVDSLEQGSIVFDDTSAQHGGALFIQSGKRAPSSREDLTTRIDRAIVYGGTTTFTYHFAVAGLREQTRLQLPLLGGEAIESVTPDIPYTVEKGAPSTLSVTLTPAAPIVTVTGHYSEPVVQLSKPDINPLEYWLFTSDPRHPVDVVCDGVEIDPSDVTSLAAQPTTRAFMVSEKNALRITPVVVSVDKGRQGSGHAMLSYTQSGGDTWMSDLTIALQTSPGLDRMVVTTSDAAHFAAVGDAPVRMFNADKDADALSLRVDNALAPMRVQWRERLGVNDWFSLLSLHLPQQTVHLDDASGHVSLLPGFVALSVWGVEHSHGDVLDGITLYAVLLALLGGALARQARLPRWALGATVILLVGLYSVDAFPHVGILALLAGSVAWVRMPDIVFVRLAERKFAHRLIRAIWALVCLSTVLQAIDYAQDRILSALHPWAIAQSGPDFYATAGGTAAMAPPAAPQLAAPMEEEAPEPSAALAPSQANGRGGARRLAARAAPGSANERSKLISRIAKEEAMTARDASPAPGTAPKPVGRVREKTVLPVAFSAPELRSVLLNFGFGALPAGQEATAHVLLVGPALRGLWMLIECAALAALTAVLLLCSKRLWFTPQRKEVTA